MTNDLNLTVHQAEALVERARRRVFALDIFRSQPHQDPFFESMHREFLLRGGNRSGKSVCAGVLFGAIAMDAYITLSDGRKIRARRPHQVGRPLIMWVIGYDQSTSGNHLQNLIQERSV